MSTTKVGLAGQVTIQLCEKIIDPETGEEKPGKVLKEETQFNDATEGFLSWMLGQALSTAPIANVVRGASKTGSNPAGQFVGIMHSGRWGLYCTNDIVDVERKDIFPRYLENIDTLTSNVTLFGVPGGGTTSGTLVPLDSSISYNRTNNGTWLTTEYTQTLGSARVRSVMYGRHHSQSDTICGLLLGEPNPQPDWVTRGTHYLFDHRTDTTRVYKTNPSTNIPAFYDFVTKEITTLPSVSHTTSGGGIFMNDMTRGVMNGGLFRDNFAYRAHIHNLANPLTTDATLASMTTVPADNIPVVFRANRTDSIQMTTARANGVLVNFPRTAGTTWHPSFQPFLVRNPENDTIEIFCCTGAGMFDVSGSQVYGVELMRAVVTTFIPAGRAFSSIADVDSAMGLITISPPQRVAILTTGGVPSTVIDATASTATNAFANQTLAWNQTGYYDHTLRRYYFPCFNGVTESGVTVLGNSAQANRMCPGFVFNENWNIVDDYISFSQTLGGFCAPVRTESGIQTIVVNTPTMYYPKVSQVMSGVVFDQTFEKSSEHVLRLIYRYQLS